ncbi:ABC-2 type transporter [Verrucomicrobia bacterium]|nr:ABC-2 type transporter [Verrucomicrobiota bacterium]
MQAYLTLTRRELGSLFLSLTGYVILAGALFLIGFSFVVLMVNLQQETTPMPLTELFYMTQLFWLILLLATPVITMRLFALEKFTGTFETLMTSPVTDFQVVLAKFTAGLVFYMVMWLPLAGCLWVVQHYTNDPTGFDAGTLASTFLGVFLLGGFFVSAGCCASALTRSQGVALMISLVFGISMYLLAVLANAHPPATTWQTKALACFDFFGQMRDFSRGVVDSRPVVFFVTLSLFFLFLTLRIVESRRWK